MTKKYKSKITYNPSGHNIFVKGEYYEVGGDRGVWVDIILKGYYNNSIFHLQTSEPNNSYYLYDFMESNFIFGR